MGKRYGLLVFLGLLVTFSLIVSACATATPQPQQVAEPTEIVQPATEEEKPVVEEAKTVEPAPETTEVTESTEAPAVVTTTEYPVWNRCDTCTPKEGGEVKVFMTDFWQANTTIWKTTAWINAKRLAFNTLLTHTDPTLTEFKPELAESWEISPDERTVTFHLRQGVKWHDGEPFTANDVEYTIKAYTHPDSGSTVGVSIKLDKLFGAQDFMEGKTDSIAGVKVIDDHTIELTTDQPVGFLFNLTSMVIVPEHILGSVAYKDLETHPFTQNWIGTGPFKFVQRVPGQYVEFARFDD